MMWKTYNDVWRRVWQFWVPVYLYFWVMFCTIWYLVLILVPLILVQKHIMMWRRGDSQAWQFWFPDCLYFSVIFCTIWYSGCFQTQGFDAAFSSLVRSRFLFCWCISIEKCSSAHLDAFQTHTFDSHSLFLCTFWFFNAFQLSSAWDSAHLDAFQAHNGVKPRQQQANRFPRKCETSFVGDAFIHSLLTMRSLFTIPSLLTVYSQCALFTISPSNLIIC